MKNYYKIFEINKKSTNEDILDAYKFKISQFLHLPFLTQQMKNDIKLLKEGYYILTNEERRKKYDIILKNKINNEEDIDNTRICNRIFSL